MDVKTCAARRKAIKDGGAGYQKRPPFSMREVGNFYSNSREINWYEAY
jgi:hypothetical protein